MRRISDNQFARREQDQEMSSNNKDRVSELNPQQFALRLDSVRLGTV